MKITRRHPSFRRQGFSLLECIAYIALVSMVLGAATIAFYRCWDDSKHLRRNAEDIVQALHAGEQWRASVRLATGSIRVIEQDGVETVIMPARTGKIMYWLTQGQLRRQVGLAAPTIVLEHVKASTMQAEKRGQVTAWRWELELATAQKNARIRPLFTFESVPGQNLTP